KSKVLWPHSNSPPAELVALCTELGMELKTYQMDLLGGIIGMDRVQIARRMTEQIKKDNQRFFDMINHPKMPVLTARTIATQCGQPRLSYITRIHRREDTIEGVKWFDRQLCDRTLRKIIGVK